MIKLYEPNYEAFDALAPYNPTEDDLQMLKHRLLERRGPGWTESIYIAYGDGSRRKLFKVVDIFEGPGRGMPIVWRRKMRNRLIRFLSL